LEVNQALYAMKGNYRLINFLLFISMMGVLAITASAYVSCGSFEADEFLDIALASPNQNPTVLPFHLNNSPLPLRPLTIIHLQRVNLLTNLLRC
jgi:hypothetical protein